EHPRKRRVDEPAVATLTWSEEVSEVFRHDLAGAIDVDAHSHRGLGGSGNRPPVAVRDGDGEPSGRPAPVVVAHHAQRRAPGPGLQLDVMERDTTTRSHRSFGGASPREPVATATLVRQGSVFPPLRPRSGAE